MRQIIFYLGCFAIMAMIACQHKEKTTEEETVKSEEVKTPVTVTTISTEPLVDYVELNATSIFQQDNIVKSNINGYIESVNTRINQYAGAGKILFVLKTKEAKSLGNTI